MSRICAVFLLAALCLTAADDPRVTFRSDVSLARVDAQVMDRDNRPIRGLRAEDFVLRVDGKQQEIRDFQSEKMPLDILLLLDVSRSMDPHVRRIAAASHEALKALGDEDRVAIMVFDRYTRVRMPFRTGGREAARELELVIDQEHFDGGTDITRGLLDAAGYMSQNGRKEARRAIVIVTDDQTERDRNDAAVSRALTRADCVLSALIAPDALQTGTGHQGRWLPDDDELQELFGGLIPRGFAMRPRTRSAGTSGIASQSGGDSMAIDEASALQNTLARIRERYALFYYLPEGAAPVEPRSIEVELSDVARRRYPDAQVRFRRSSNLKNGPDDNRPIRV